jgi:hypothetical protein
MSDSKAFEHTRRLADYGLARRLSLGASETIVSALLSDSLQCQNRLDADMMRNCPCNQYEVVDTHPMVWARIQCAAPK